MEKEVCVSEQGVAKACCFLPQLLVLRFEREKYALLLHKEFNEMKEELINENKAQLRHRHMACEASTNLTSFMAPLAPK